MVGASLLILLINPAQTKAAPYGGTARSVPGIIQAEDFDTGGEGMGYHDTSASNTAGSYRPSEGVDIENSTNPSGAGYNVGDTKAGEWMSYTINVTTSGTYTIQAIVTSGGAGNLVLSSSKLIC